MVRNFKIYSASNLQECNTVLLTVVTMVYISWLFILNLEVCTFLSPFTYFSHPYPLPLAITNLSSVSIFHGKIRLSECCSHIVSLSSYVIKVILLKWISHFFLIVMSFHAKSCFKFQSSLK